MLGSQCLLPSAGNLHQFAVRLPSVAEFGVDQCEVVRGGNCRGRVRARPSLLNVVSTLVQASRIRILALQVERIRKIVHLEANEAMVRAEGFFQEAEGAQSELARLGQIPEFSLRSCEALQTQCDVRMVRTQC